MHTDINPSNICIKRSENGFIVTYIDFDESFYSTDPQKSGRGTVGYYAPEFFLNPEMCAKQFEIRTQSEALLVSMLKPNFQEFFSQASDIYALGCVLLNDLKLTENSVYYSFVQRMCAPVPDDRPKAEEIINLFESQSAQQINQIKPAL